MNSRTHKPLVMVLSPKLKTRTSYRTLPLAPPSLMP
jgi:hypothetical protein